MSLNKSRKEHSEIEETCPADALRNSLTRLERGIIYDGNR